MNGAAVGPSFVDPDTCEVVDADDEDDDREGDCACEAPLGSHDNAVMKSDMPMIRFTSSAS